MAIGHLEQRRQRLVRLQRKEFHVIQPLLQGLFFQSDFAATLTHNHKQPRLLAKVSRGCNHIFQPLLFTNVAGVKNDFFIFRQSQRLSQLGNVLRVNVAKAGHF